MINKWLIQRGVENLIRINTDHSVSGVWIIVLMFRIHLTKGYRSWALWVLFAYKMLIMITPRGLVETAVNPW